MESCEDESKQQTQSQNALKKNNSPIHYLNRRSTMDITMSIKKRRKRKEQVRKCLSELLDIHILYID